MNSLPCFNPVFFPFRTSLTSRFAMAAVLSLSFAHAPVSAQTAASNNGALAPEALAQRYVNAFINDDANSHSALYAGRVSDADAARFQTNIRNMAARAASTAAMGNLGEFTKTVISDATTLSPAQRAKLESLAQAQVRAIQKTQCQVVSSKVLDACWAGQPPRTEVHLSCKVPDIPAWSAGKGTSNPASWESYFSRLSAAWEGPATESLPVKMRLRTIEKTAAWELDPSHDPRGIIAAISAKLSPEILLNKHTYVPGATNMVLNPCIYRNTEDFNNPAMFLKDSFWKFASPADVTQVVTRFGDASTLVFDVDADTTAFHIALANKASLPAMQALRKQLSFMPGLSGYRSSLLTEAIKGHQPPATIQWLIEQGAPVDEMRESFMRPVIYAVTEGADAKTIDTLVAAGADLSYYNNTDYPDLDALRAAMETDSVDARRAMARHLPLPPPKSELMQYLLNELSRGVRYSPQYPDATSDILPILVGRGLGLDETYCNTSARLTCTPAQRSNLMDMALGIGNPTLIDFFARKGLKPKAG